jgi:hypothetical protein
MDVTKVNEPNLHAAPPILDHASYSLEVGAEVVRFKVTSDFARNAASKLAGRVTRPLP